MVQYAPAPLARERKPQPTLEEIQTSRKIAEAMMREGSSYEPVQHWTQGAARVMQALSGSIGNAQANSKQQLVEGDASDALMGLYKPPSVTGGMPPVPASAMQPEPAMSQEEASIGKFANPNIAPSPVASALDPSLVQAVKGFEGYTPKAQWDYKQHSVGYGTRGKPGEVIDQATAEQRLGDELTKAQNIVQQFAPGAPDGVKKALTSLTYNAGADWTNSGLGAAVKRGDWQEAQRIFLQYNKAGGQTLPGLVDRRQQEAQWFNQQPQAQPAMALGGPQQQPQAAQPQPQQMPMQMADASQGQGMTRETLQRLLANPMTREFGQKMLLQEQQRNQPMSEKDRLDLEYRRAQINDLQNKQRLDQDRTRQIEALGLDPNSPEALAIQANGKLPAKAYELLKAKEMRSEAAAKITAGLSNLNKMTTKYNDAAFESSVGPIQGAAPDGYLNSIPINAARLLGEIGNNISGGNSSPTEVRSDIASSTEALAAAIKPLIRGPGEGPWTDADQARLVAIVGDLSTSRDKSEFKRRLNNVRDSLTSNFNMNIPFDAMGGTQPQAQGGGQQPAQGGATHIWNPQTGRPDPVGGR